jgi:pyrophosphate--fructose-6-phosphate 1-phosphotransferase
MQNISPLQVERLKYSPKLPSVLAGGLKNIELVDNEPSTAVADVDALKELFPETFGQPSLSVKASDSASEQQAYKVGVVLSGGPAPGGHNVILGLYDALKALNPSHQLFGFKKGPGGIVDNDTLEITDKIADQFRNTGGFDIIMSGRTKIESPEQFAACMNNCGALGLKALLVIGGDDSNTNAALLAEYFKSNGSNTQVVGAPKTIDGDLKNDKIEASFGFDTACKTYAELVGNIARDAISSVKYYHFIKLMGRSASHIALEVGLQTQANLTLIGEEVEAKSQTLGQLVDQIAEVVVDRAKQGKDYGVILVPEGIIEFIPEVGRLISNLNDSMAHHEVQFNAISEREDQLVYVVTLLDETDASLFKSLPQNIQLQLIADRDPHGNVQVSLIETEKLLSQMVAEKLDILKDHGEYKGKFAVHHHFFGYEGRCAAPSNFDADYAYGLGTVACALIDQGKTGYISCLKDLHLPAEQWVPMGIPLTSMMNMEKRHGKDKPVIRKALVELDGAPFKTYTQYRADWAKEDAYVFPGPIQYFGPSSVADVKTISLNLEKTAK